MSKKFAQEIINEIHTKSSDPNDQLRRVINMCAEEGATHPITEPTAPPKPSKPPTRASRTGSAKGEVAGGMA